jgi:serine/threonine-protein kinase
MAQILERDIERPSLLARDVPEGLDRAVLRAAARKRENRFATAREMSQALEEALAPATARQVEHWLNGLVGDALEKRAARVADVERGSSAPLAEPLKEGAEPSTIDDISRASHGPRPRATRRSLLAVGVGCLALGAIAFALLARFGLRGASARDVPSLAAAPALASSNPPLPGLRPDALPSATSDPDVERTSASGARAMPTAPSDPSRDRALPRPQPSRRQRPSPGRNCSPPYTLDAEGVRIAKPECL